VEAEGKGWDLEATCGDRLLRVEVKGLSGQTIGVQLTPNKYKKMKEFKHTYHVCVVTEVLDQRRCHLHVFTYCEEHDGWGDEKGTPIKIEEETAAWVTV